MIMKRRFEGFCLLLAVASLVGYHPPAVVAANYNETPLPYRNGDKALTVAAVKYDWQDEKRDRKVPVKIYYPQAGDGPFPVIIFSHGLGGSRDGYEYLGQYWASHGYVSVHVQHLGSDSALIQGVPPVEMMEKFRSSVANPQNAINRLSDVTFAIDEVKKLNKNDPTLKGRLDLNRVGMAGHSFGAFTTQAIIGEIFTGLIGKEVSTNDTRIKAAISMSPFVPLRKEEYDTAFTKVKIPCFYMTGSLDNSPIGETRAEERRIPFDHAKNADEFLTIFKGGDHMVFSGRLRRQLAEKDPVFQKLICQSSTAFWDAYLRGDDGAKEWLTGNGFESELDGNGTFEKKLKSN